MYEPRLVEGSKDKMTHFVDYIYGEVPWESLDLTRTLKDTLYMSKFLTLKRPDLESWESAIEQTDCRDDLQTSMDRYLWEFMTLNALYMERSKFRKLCAPFVDYESMPQTHRPGYKRVLESYFKVTPVIYEKYHARHMMWKFREELEADVIVEREQEDGEEDESVWMGQRYVPTLPSESGVYLSYHYVNNQDPYPRRSQTGRAAQLVFGFKGDTVWHRGTHGLEWRIADLKPSIIPICSDNWWWRTYPVGHPRHDPETEHSGHSVYPRCYYSVYIPDTSEAVLA